MTARSRRTVVTTALLAAFAAVPPASAATAGTYTVHSCRDAAGKPLAAHAWLGDPKDPGAGDRCAEGGPLEVLAGESGDLSALRFAAPAGTAIAGYRVHLTAATGSAPDSLRLEAGVGEGSLLELPPVSAGCLAPNCSFGDEDDPLSPKNLVTAGGLATPALALVARCGLECVLRPPWPEDQGGEPWKPTGTLARARLWSSAVEIADPHDPSLGPAGGSLLGAQPVSGRASVTALATDEGGGVASVKLFVDGAERARTTACGEPYTLPAPCPASLPVSIELDTAVLADGQHTAELVATDAAGNSASSGPLAFGSANTPPPPPAPPPPPPGSGTSAGGGGSPAGGAAVLAPAALLRAEVAVGQTEFRLPARGRRIRGVVRRSDGTPAAGARLVLRSRRFGFGAPRARVVRELKAGADGRFSSALPAAPGRLVVELDDDAYRTALSDEIRVLGPLRIGIKAIGKDLRNGSTMVLLADIAGAGGDEAAADRTLLVQAKVDGRWATVDSVETGAKGSASWRYKFRATTRPTRYRFRVRVPRGGDDWPWPATSSRAVSVLVKP